MAAEKGNRNEVADYAFNKIEKIKLRPLATVAHHLGLCDSVARFFKQNASHKKTRGLLMKKAETLVRAKCRRQQRGVFLIIPQNPNRPLLCPKEDFFSRPLIFYNALPPCFFLRKGGGRISFFVVAFLLHWLWGSIRLLRAPLMSVASTSFFFSPRDTRPAGTSTPRFGARVIAYHTV